MSTSALKTPIKSVASDNSSNSINTISGRQSKALVVGFCGAIGAGIKTVKKITKNQLELTYPPNLRP